MTKDDYMIAQSKGRRIFATMEIIKTTIVLFISCAALITASPVAVDGGNTNVLFISFLYIYPICIIFFIALFVCPYSFSQTISIQTGEKNYRSR